MTRGTAGPEGQDPPTKRGRLVIVGTGISAISHFTLETIGHIEQADEVFFHVTNGVTASYVRMLNSNAVDLYQYYGEGKRRRDTYVQMAEALLQAVRKEMNVVGVFHGHPGIFVSATRRALAIAESEGYETELLPGVSSVDCLFSDLRIDPGVLGVQIVNASRVLAGSVSLDLTGNVVLLQVGAVGDHTFSFSGYKHATVSRLFDVLIEIYGPQHKAVHYIAPIFPGVSPVIDEHRLSEYREPNLSTKLGTSLLYLPPKGMLLKELTARQAFRNRDPYGMRERRAVAELKDHQVPVTYRQRRASAQMLLAMLELATDPDAMRQLYDAPAAFVERYPHLETREREAIAARDRKKLRSVTTDATRSL